MSKTDRVQQLHRILLSHRYPLSKRLLAERLECTEKSITRYLNELKDRHLAPLEYARGKGYYYNKSNNNSVELPGLWLTETDIQSLLLLLDMLENFSEGTLSKELASINNIICTLLQNRGVQPHTIKDRIRIIPIGHNVMPDKNLPTVFHSVIARQQLQLHYRDYQGRISQRTISPQRLIYYRDNWFLDAWCHLREGLRTFSLARAKAIESTTETAIDIEIERLNEHFRSGYGLFAGPAKHAAVLRFLPEIAHEIACQQWHPQQQGQWDGTEFLLTLPYSEDAELVQDILRHSPYVYVEKPAALRKKVQNRLQSALDLLTGKRIYT